MAAALHHDRRSVTAPARPAATVCVMRSGPHGPEVLMVRRERDAGFMAGTWVFPGGTLDPADGSAAAATVTGLSVGNEQLPWVAAALRELTEEVGIWVTRKQLPPAPAPAHQEDQDFYTGLQRSGAELAGDRLAYFANWITPAALPIRFDARFYAVEVEPDTAASPDGREIDRAQWIRPEDAVARARARSWPVAVPTVRVLESLCGHSSVASLLGALRSLPAPEPIQPRLALGDDDEIRVVLPREAGYDDIGDGPASDALLEKLSQVPDES